MYDLLFSIKPYYAYLIIRGIKTLEVRKNEHRGKNWSGKVKCYVSKDIRSFNRIPEVDKAEVRKLLGMVAFEFIKGGIIFELGLHTKYGLRDCCLTHDELNSYAKGKKIYGYRVNKLKVYVNPKNLMEFSYPSEKYCEKGLCGNCLYEEPLSESGEVNYGCNWMRPIMRPPQSYMKIM